MILGPLALVLTLGLLIFSFFAPTVASAIFILFVIALDLLVFSADRARTPPSRLSLFPREEEIYRRHAVYIRYPGGSAEVCAALQATRWLSLLWLPWLLWCELWWPAGILLAHFLVTGSISVRMNPVGPYRMAASEGNVELGAYATVIEDLLARLHNPESD